MRSGLAVYGTLAFLLLALLTATPQAALALTASQVYEQVKDSVVVVKAYNKQGKQVGLGSGVMLPSGDVITNYHVVKKEAQYKVGRGKKGVPATFKGVDEDKDLCLLTAPGLKAKPARLGKTTKLKVGDPVYAVGAPQGLELSLSEGIVSQLRGGPPPIIQTTVAISPGSSGGGLFNADGELVGITTFYLKDSQSLNFAVPVEWIGQVRILNVDDFDPPSWIDRGVAGEKIRERPRGEAPVAPEKGAGPKDGWEGRLAALDNARDWQGMLALCRRWTQAEPGNEYAWYKLGYAYGKLDSHREAAQAFREALCLKPDDAKAWYCLSVAYVNLGRYQEAIEACREALCLKPDDAEAWLNLGFAYAELGRHREAVKAYREALRLNPDYVDVWNNLGVTYGKLSRYIEAIEAFREALLLKPDYASAWNNLGVAYALSGNRSAALQAVKELRRYDPKKADELFLLIMKR